MKEPFTFLDPNNHYLKAIDLDWYKNLVKIENIFNVATVNFYAARNIITMHLPVSTGSISSPMGRGSDSLPVRVNLNGVDTYLADSMQFMLEYGCRLSDNGVYYLMPSFRGEKADERHLCEFYHSEVEIPGTLDDIMLLAEEYVRYLAKCILQAYHEKIIHLDNIAHIEKAAYNNQFFSRISFDDAEKYFEELVGKKKIHKYIEYCDGYRNITRQGEQELLKKYPDAVWIMNYDELAVPFYQKRTGDGKAKNADLLMGIGETIGCGERHFSRNELLDALCYHEVNSEEYAWYIKLKEKCPLQTSGFGMGVERFLMWVLNATDIRNMQICLRFNGMSILP